MTTSTGMPNRAGERVIDLRPSRAAPSRSGSEPRRRIGRTPALDGLRAIAVVAVLLYHADVVWMPGGFLGVDVFFVLSGFLITTLLLDGAARRGVPDLRTFYLRRARRLLPALFGVLVGSTLLVIAVAPDAAGHQQRDVPAALVYLTNWVYVITDQSYFASIGRPPLLEHLWSLAVEDQFYLIWPWVFLFAWRAGRTARVGRFAIAGAAASTALMLALSVRHGYPTPNDPSRVYLGTDTHAMGVLVGAALATVWAPARVRSNLAAGARAIIDGTGLLALVLLLAVFATVGSDSALLYRGGFLALCLLVALLLVAASHPASRVGQMLGAAPLVYLGSRSYGIYLWHWPVFLVTRPGLDVPVTGWANHTLRIVLTLGVAELSYRLVEMPVRRHGFGGAWRSLLTLIAAPGGPFAVLARRPLVIAVILGTVLLGITHRLYSLPAQSGALAGMTSLTAIDAAVVAPASPPRTDAVPAASPAPAPVVQPGILGIGESVMIGASRSLERRFPGMAIDAEVGRQPEETLSRVAAITAAGALREEAVVHLGSNGAVGAAALRQILDTFAEHGVDRIVMVNVSVPRRWQDPNNAVLRSVADEYPDAAIADWHAAVLADPSLVNADGVHASEAGAERYAALIADAFAALKSRAAPG